MEQSETHKNIRGVIRCRPLLTRELNSQQTSQWVIEGNTIKLDSTDHQAVYTFDKIYDTTSTNKELYDAEVQPIVEQFMKGINGTIFAYGQSSSGKTFTMHGDKDNPGVIRLAATQIFHEIAGAPKESSFVIKLHYIEIYNEKVYDLLDDRQELNFEKFINGQIDGKLVNSAADILKVFNTGNANRRVSKTNLNDRSSRSHTILQINIRCLFANDDRILVSMLNLVDLAGSESIVQSGATGERLTETCKINLSLLTLGIVIHQLSVKNSGHLNYRDSKLTHMLRNSLGGNSMTLLICTITPAEIEETDRTLVFASRAMKIQNKPVVNEVTNDAIDINELDKLIAALEKHSDKPNLIHIKKHLPNDITEIGSESGSLGHQSSHSQNIRRLKMNKDRRTSNVAKVKESPQLSPKSILKNVGLNNTLMNPDESPTLKRTESSNLHSLDSNLQEESPKS